MKIGILTYHRSYNYGAFMQCYALLTRIKNDLPEISIEVIDYTTEYTIESYKKSLSLRSYESKQKLIIRNSIFEEYQNKYLPLSEYHLISNDFNILFDAIRGKYDVIVVGSDAVWNWSNKTFPNAYFLGKDLLAKKMSYAASSHGMDFYSISDDHKSILKQYLEDFVYLGVRESTTENMLKFIAPSCTVYQNCDPTVLLDLNNLPVDMGLLKKKMKKAGIDFSKPIIGLMAENHLGKEIREYFGDKAQIVAVYEPNIYANFFLYDLSPFEWARIFSFFDITVTHFFHGTMLSLRNLTPVIAIELGSKYSRKHSTKIKNVIENLNLPEFYEVLNVRDLSYSQKILKKLGFSKNRLFWKNVCRKIEYYMKNPQKDRIYTAFEIEEKKYHSFRDYLSNLLNN